VQACGSIHQLIFDCTDRLLVYIDSFPRIKWWLTLIQAATTHEFAEHQPEK
jgi:hypothetical protein